MTNLGDVREGYRTLSQKGEELIALLNKTRDLVDEIAGDYQNHTGGSASNGTVDVVAALSAISNALDDAKPLAKRVPEVFASLRMGI